MRRRLMQFAARTGLMARSGRAADRLVPSPSTACTVLTFHRLDTGAADLYPGLAGLSPERFEVFVQSVARSFEPVGVTDLVRAMQGSGRLPERAVLFTFDDAYLDFAEVAWPIMREAGVPVVLFVPTAYVGRPERTFWWDDLFAALDGADPEALQRIGVGGVTSLEAFRELRGTIKSMPNDEAMERVRYLVTQLRVGAANEPDPEICGRVLDWDELRSLASGGVDLAPHSRTHPMLDQLPPGELDDEIAGSLADMRTALGGVVRNVFAYPSGGHDLAVRDAVRRAGFDAAFTTERGIVDIGHADATRLPRINIGPNMTSEALQLERALHHLRGRAQRVVSKR